MDSLVFHLDADKITPALLDSIKAYYGNRRVQITVRPDDPVPNTLIPTGATTPDYALPYDDIARIADALDRNEPIDMAAEMERVNAMK